MQVLRYTIISPKKTILYIYIYINSIYIYIYIWDTSYIYINHPLVCNNLFFVDYKQGRQGSLTSGFHSHWASLSWNALVHQDVDKVILGLQITCTGIVWCRQLHQLPSTCKIASMLAKCIMAMRVRSPKKHITYSWIVLQQCEACLSKPKRQTPWELTTQHGLELPAMKPNKK